MRTVIKVVLSAVIDHKERLLKARRFVIVACGTSLACRIDRETTDRKFCCIPVEVEYASEFRYRVFRRFMVKTDAVIAISQSGETLYIGLP